MSSCIIAWDGWHGGFAVTISMIADMAYVQDVVINLLAMCKTVTVSLFICAENAYRGIWIKLA
jgi:hypothetical protein